jgi:quercetin dioxygenase-like cupin family protein
MSDNAVSAAELGVVRPFERIEWVDEAKFGRVSSDVTDAARKLGARRKFMSYGEEGLYVQFSELPAGYHIAPHTHSHGEVLFILEGSCTVEPTGQRLGPNDSAVVPGGQEYGILCGDEGMKFLTIRAGEANTNFSK